MLYPSNVEPTSLDRNATRPLSSAAGSEGVGFRAWVEGGGSFSGIWPSLAGYPAGHRTSSGTSDDSEESTRYWPPGDFQFLDLKAKANRNRELSSQSYDEFSQGCASQRFKEGVNDPGCLFR